MAVAGNRRAKRTESHRVRGGAGGFRVQRSMCATCIYRPDNPLDLETLEREVAGPHGGFRTFRVCHHSRDACCRGFWERHADQFPAGQIAQRLSLVVFVEDDVLKEDM